MTRDTDLLPCPFCGQTNVTIFGPVGWDRKYGVTHSCRVFFGGAGDFTIGGRSREDAVAAWNTRQVHASEPVAWTGSGSMAALVDGREGFIYRAKADAHPIPLYAHPVQEPPSPGAMKRTSDLTDADYERAIGILIRSQRASTSHLQRRMNIGYNAAAKLIECAEDDGIVSRPNDVGKREVMTSAPSGQRFSQENKAEEAMTSGNSGQHVSTPAPVVPAEGLDDAVRGLQHMLDQYAGKQPYEGYPKALQAGIDAITALRSAPPVGARVTVQEAARVLLDSLGTSPADAPEDALLWRKAFVAGQAASLAPVAEVAVALRAALAALLPAGEGE